MGWFWAECSIESEDAVLTEKLLLFWQLAIESGPQKGLQC